MSAGGLAPWPGARPERYRGSVTTIDRAPTRNPAAELAGHLLLATALAEKTAAAVPAHRRAEADALVQRLEEAVGMAYQLAPAVREGSIRLREREKVA